MGTVFWWQALELAFEDLSHVTEKFHSIIFGRTCCGSVLMGLLHVCGQDS